MFFLCKVRSITPFPVPITRRSSLRPVLLYIPHAWHIRVGCTLDVATKCFCAVSSAHRGGNVTPIRRWSHTILYLAWHWYACTSYHFRKIQLGCDGRATLPYRDQRSLHRPVCHLLHPPNQCLQSPTNVAWLYRLQGAKESTVME